MVREDKEDARWIARLTEMGMLRSSFVPPPEIRALRVCTRHIWDLTADRTRYWQRLEKLLEDALCKLASAVSKLAGQDGLRLSLLYYECGEASRGLCKVKSQIWDIPIQKDASASARAIHLHTGTVGQGK